MRKRGFVVAYPATAQISRLPKKSVDALSAFFASEDRTQSPNTKKLDEARYISRVLDKRVVWSERAGMPEVLSVVDESYAPRS